MFQTSLLSILIFLPSIITFTINNNEIRDLEDHTSYFTQETASWSLSNGLNSSAVTQCNGTYLLGGSGALTFGSTLERTYSNIPSHNLVYFSINVWIMDLQDIRNLFSIYFNSQIIGLWNTLLLLNSSAVSICAGTAPDYPSITITGKIPHSATSLTFKIKSLVDSLGNPPSLGFRDLSLLFLNGTGLDLPSSCQFSALSLGSSCMCPAGTYNGGLSLLTGCSACSPACKSCIGSSENDCTSCKAGFSFIGQKCQACAPSCDQCSGTTEAGCLKCSSNYFRFWNSTCKPTCTAPLVTRIEGDYKYCDLPCGTSGFLNTLNVCQSTCEAPLIQEQVGEVKKCKSPCLANEYYHMNLSTCVPDCNAPLVVVPNGILNMCKIGSQARTSSGSASGTNSTTTDTNTSNTSTNNTASNDNTNTNDSGSLTNNTAGSNDSGTTNTSSSNTNDTTTSTGAPTTDNTTSTTPASGARSGDPDPDSTNNNSSTSGTTPDENTNPDSTSNNTPSTGGNDSSNTNTPSNDTNTDTASNNPSDTGGSDNGNTSGSGSTTPNNDNKDIESKTDTKIPSIPQEVIQQVSAGAVVAVSFLRLNDPTSLLLVSLSDLLKYIQFLDIGYPKKVLDSFKNDDSEIISFDLGLSFEIPDSVKDSLPDNQLPPSFERESVHSSFLVNFWDKMNSFILPIALVLLVWPLETLIIKTKKKVPIALIRRVKIMLKWNFILLIFFTVYDDLTLFTFLELRYLRLNSFISVMSFLICLCMTSLGVYLLWKVVKISKESARAQIFPVSGNSPNKVQSFCEKWEAYQVVFGAFKNTSFKKQAYLFFFTLRTIFCYIIVSTLYQHPITQTILLTIAGLMMFGYLAKERPMKDRFNMIESISYELILFVVNICVLILACLDHLELPAVEVRDNIGQVIILSNLIVDILSIAFILIALIHSIIMAIKARKAKNGRGQGGWLNVLMVPYSNLGMELETHHSTHSPQILPQTAHTVSNITIDVAKSSEKLLTTNPQEKRTSFLVCTNILTKEDENLATEHHIQSSENLTKEKHKGSMDLTSEQPAPPTEVQAPLSRFQQLKGLRGLHLMMERTKLNQLQESVDVSMSGLDSPAAVVQLLQKVPESPATPQNHQRARLNMWNKLVERSKRSSICSDRSVIHDQHQNSVGSINGSSGGVEDIEEVKLAEIPLKFAHSAGNADALERNTSKSSYSSDAISGCGTPKNHRRSRFMLQRQESQLGEKEKRPQTMDAMTDLMEVQAPAEISQGRRFLANIRNLRKKKKLTTIIETKLQDAKDAANEQDEANDSSIDSSKDSQPSNKASKRENLDGVCISEENELSDCGDTPSENKGEPLDLTEIGSTLDLNEAQYRFATALQARKAQSEGEPKNFSIFANLQ